MLHKLFAGALAALLLSALPSTIAAQTRDTTDNVVPECVTGQAAGIWDLPYERATGRMRGRMADEKGVVRFVVEARLAPAPLLGVRGGTVEGVLLPVTSTGIGTRPVAAVKGTYVLGADGRGQFETVIVPLDPVATTQPSALGKLAGAFSDPQLRKENTLGRFVGRWAICR